MIYGTISGVGGNTNPQAVIWFCHVCMSSFTLPVGKFHVCEPMVRDTDERNR